MALVRKELIRPERSTLPGEDAFRFRHLLIRDSAYEAIPKARRAELHERFADWLERVAGDAVSSRRRSSATTSSRRTCARPSSDHGATVPMRSVGELRLAWPQQVGVRWTARTSRPP